MNPQDLTSIHKLFCALTGRSMPYAVAERRWFEWVKYFKDEDLKIVVNFIKHENKRHRDWQYSMRFGRLIGDLENFGDLLSDARGALRNRRPAQTPKEQVLQQWHPTVAEPPAGEKVVHIKDALRRAVDGL